MTFDVEALRNLADRCPRFHIEDETFQQDLRQAADEIEKLRDELLAARAVVEAARPTITNASEWKQDKFYVSLGALSEAIGAYDKATQGQEDEA